jgi:hypothetical protein
MALSDHVVSLELAKKWKDSGGGQDTEFEWSYISGKWSILPSIECEHGESCIAAPLASEMMEWLPKYVGSYYLIVTKSALCGPYLVTYEDANRDHLEIFTGNNLPNALMQMLLERREEK